MATRVETGHEGTQARTRDKPPTQRLHVNFIACDGRQLCAELLPEVITLDDFRSTEDPGNSEAPPRHLWLPDEG